MLPLAPQQAAQILTGDDIGLKVVEIENRRVDARLLARVDGAWLAADLATPQPLLNDRST